MYTPEEASKLWCPFIRLVPQIKAPKNEVIKKQAGNPGNVFIMEDGSPFRPGCISVGCMMWRWSYFTPTLDEAGKPTMGFCGLAPRTAGANPK